ncbi:hypothetical protein [Streptomyces sp. WMMB303]|uniref:hypothetical protein n=1 Tax=Streptomyces sp. WMMB303 TaxID=3034154 RepID=UPI0023ECDAD7|nr:hypothetical protein [Streptomyces sp. WMMB303]MDF4252592.1 hypothetical protein [Streptomyces sp. WMMB303]
MHPDVIRNRFRERSDRIGNLGIVLLMVAAVLWIWCGVLLTMSYEVQRRFSDESFQCEPRLSTDAGTANQGGTETPRADERDWPEAVVLLGLSVPVSVAGAVFLTYGRLSVRMSKHVQELETARGRAAAAA